MNILETTIKARELFSGFELCRLQEEETRKLQERLENKKITIDELLLADLANLTVSDNRGSLL